MKINFGIILISTICAAAQADDAGKRGTLEIAVYQSAKAGIVAIPDAKQWMQQKLIVSQTITLTNAVPDSIQIKTATDGKVYEFQFTIGGPSTDYMLKNGKISISGGTSPITFDHVPMVFDEWMACSSREKITGQNHLSTLIVAKYTKADPSR